MHYLPSDLAKLLNVTTNTIRRYEASGFFESKRDSSNYRYYEDFDLNKAAMIGLYKKCGFSHTEINDMIENDNDEITKIYVNRFDELEKEMERLKRIKHWLKDNIELMNTIDKLRDSYTTMDCPQLKYMLYRKGDEILKDKKYLEKLKYFLYDIPEIQHITIFKKADLERGKIVRYSGWAMREIEMKKFNAEEFIQNESEFIETYKKQKCLYGTLEISSDDVYDESKAGEKLLTYYNKAKKYAMENNFVFGDNMTETIVSPLGNVTTYLMCIPIIENI